MEKEILEQYNKVKDILSEEEFLAEMDEVRPNFEDLPFMNEVDVAKEVVKNHIGADDISKTEDSLEENNDDSMLLHQDWIAECVNRGVFFASHHNHFINAALTHEDINRTIEIADEAFKVVKNNHPELFK